MSEVRGMRKTRVGVVVSDKMDKTITIAVKYRVRHPLYGKIMNRTTKIKAHDENNGGVALATPCASWRPVRLAMTSAGAWSRSSRRRSPLSDKEEITQ